MRRDSEDSASADSVLKVIVLSLAPGIACHMLCSYGEEQVVRYVTCHMSHRNECYIVIVIH